MHSQSRYPRKLRHHITTPQEALGFDIGDDYHLANYTQLTAWWQKLATESDRMKLVEIGKTEEGRPECMVILTSPENQKHLLAIKRSRAGSRMPKDSRTTRPARSPTKAKP